MYCIPFVFNRPGLLRTYLGYLALAPILYNMNVLCGLVLTFLFGFVFSIIVSGDLPELKLLLSEDKVVRTVKVTWCA